MTALRSIPRSTLALLVILGFAGCAGSIPHPTEPDARWAAARWPGTTLAELERGRTLFVGRCSGCHSLPAPESRPPEAWSKLVGDMIDDAKLEPADADLVVRFLSSASARQASKPSASR